MTDNRCEVCRFFSGEASDWPPYKPDATKAAASFLSVLFRDAKAAVKMLEVTLSRLSEWAFQCTDGLAASVDALLVARSAIISFFLDSMSSYNPDALRGDKDHGRDAINAKWSSTDCIAQLSMHCMNIRFSGSQKIIMRPLAKLVNNITYVVRVIQQRFSSAVEEICKSILSMPDGQILKSSLRSVMPEVGDCISDIMQQYKHLMVSGAMYASALFLLESGMFPHKCLTQPVGTYNRHHYRRHGRTFSRFEDFVSSCHVSHGGCSPLHLLLALSFSIPPPQLTRFFQCEDDMGITAIAGSLLARLSASSSPFRPQPACATNALPDSALKQLIISSLSDAAKQKKDTGTDDFGSGNVDADVADVQEAQSSDDDGGSQNSEGSVSGDEADDEGPADDLDASRRRCVHFAPYLAASHDVPRFDRRLLYV